MSYIHNHSIVGLETEKQPREDLGYVVTHIHHRCITTNLQTNESIKTYHILQLQPPNPENFIMFDTITNTQKHKWLMDNMDALSVETQNINLLLASAP